MSSTQSSTPAEVKAVRVADLVLLAMFLGLTFLLGVFPLNDTDFWWHLRTGDLIRQTGQIPRVDLYTFGASDHRWIDLHWMFQVALSWLNQWGGIDAINLAKCVVTTLAVGLLVTAKRREWPLWAMILAWLPSLLLLSGRMYVRPETVTLLYIAIDLAVLFRVDHHPRLVWILPVVQLFWVNTQGLFIFGPILFGMYVTDAAVGLFVDVFFRRAPVSKERLSWWRTILLAGAAMGLACFVNPYGIYGALFPLELLGTMNNPAFRKIAELQPLLDFAEKADLGNPFLQIHFVTLILGAMSFVVPIVWRAFDRLLYQPVDEELSRKSKRKPKKKKVTDPLWKLSFFRLLLYATFTGLSFKATRNSHQFATVVGTVTAWNFGEWAAALRFRRLQIRSATHPLMPRVALMVLLAGIVGIVGSGKFYEWTGEGRTVSLGERPIWYPHEAVKFAGSEGMPRRFLVFHNGHAGLFEYHNGPKQKVFADARLEVMGATVSEQDNDLGASIAMNRPGWSQRVASLDSPVPGILIDHVQDMSAKWAASVLGDSQWRCVWYDPIASVYLHKSVSHRAKTVDFAARHFGLQPENEPRGRDAMLAMARTIRSQLYSLLGRDERVDLARPMILLGSDYARRAIEIDPRDAEGWKLLGQLHVYRASPVPRIDMPFDPIEDLPLLNAIYHLEQAAQRNPENVPTLSILVKLYLKLGMDEAAANAADRLLRCSISPEQAAQIKPDQIQIARVQAQMKSKPSTRFENMSELNQVVTKLLEAGFVASAADVFEQGYKRPEERSWEVTDRIATLRLRHGRPDLARRIWETAIKLPRPALQESRIAATYFLENDFDDARQHYRKALAIEPNLFDALYGMATLENDAGRASEALAYAELATKAASSSTARLAAKAIADFARPYADIKKSARAKP